MNRLVEVHVLQNFVPSNLNRDETGAPKDALFGGSRRARISSQCQKRAMRRMFAGGSLLGRDDLGVRTKRLVDEVASQLVGKGRPDAEVPGKIRAALPAIGLAVNEEGRTEYLLFLGRREIQALSDAIDAQWDSILSAGDDEPATKKTRKERAGQGSASIAKALGKVFQGGKAADIALFGRMLADMPEANQEAACQVAHAISTHTVEREFDYYTAIDDCKPAEESGAEMIGATDFNSACFYRYACLDVDRLENNLQGDRELTCRAVRAFLDAFARSEPSGKQSSFAAHNPPEFILVRAARNEAPVNLANAFESPVRPSLYKSLSRLSAERLAEKAQRLRLLYGHAGDSFVLNACDAAMPDDLGEAMSSWSALLDRVAGIMEER